MDTQSIKELVRAYLLKEFLPGEDPQQLTDDLPLISGKILDSLATIKVVAFLEETFGFEVQAHELGPQNLDSINRIADFVSAKR